MTQKNVRLAEHIIPKRYSITLFPNLSEFTFTGEEEIILEIAKPTKKITLHAVELKINSAKIFVSKKEIDALKIIYDEKLETATILFKDLIPKGECKLKLKFTGILNDKMRGFYRIKYLHEDKERHMAVTQFESTDARRAFPSFDEPNRKAVFNIKLIVPEDHTAISNTPEEDIAIHSPGYKIVSFGPTPKMSTYLLAFIVGKFEYIESNTKSGIRVRVFTTPGKKHQAKFALDVAKKCLEFYENYFGIAYPLPTLSLIAIPDFASGAMENWGAVTYRETSILVDENLSATANKQNIAYTIAHELAHMWFGNLVTMEWWTHLWLNEGFATYIGWLAVDNIFPKWDIWTQFVYTDHSSALKLDSLKNTHPIEVEVNHPAEIWEIFDEISYEKGASIIRMLASYLGEEAFRKGLQNYLKKHQYSNATTEDLWDALRKTSGKNVKKIMDNWTKKAGYPLVSIAQKNNKFELNQQRYFLSPLSTKEDSDKTIWSIPIDEILFSGKSKLISNEIKKLNNKEKGFYRIQYPESFLSQFKKQIKKLPSEDRFGIIRDLFSLSQSGQRSTADALDFIKVFENETEYIIWGEIISNLRTIDNLIFKENFYNKYREFCLGVLEKIAKKMGWEKIEREFHTQVLLRNIVLYAFGRNGDRKTLEKAKELFEDLLSKKINLDSDFRGVVYNLIAEIGQKDDYERLERLYFETFFQEEKNRIFRALCSFKNIELIKKTLKMAFSDKMRAQDRFKAISFTFANHAGQELAWSFVKDNWSEITKDFAGSHLYPRFIEPAALFSDSQKACEIEEFFKKNPSVGLKRTIAQVTEQIRANDLWLRRDRKNLLKFFNH